MKIWKKAQQGWITTLPSVFAVGLIVMLLTALPAPAQDLTWKQTNGPHGGGPVTSLLATPDGTLYAAQFGEWDPLYRNGEVFRSKDGGNSWTKVHKVGGSAGGAVNSLAVVGTTLFAGGTSISIIKSTFRRPVIDRSDDEGNSWNSVLPGKFSGLTATIVNSFAVTGMTIYAGTENGVFRSDDKGDSWFKTELGYKNVLSLAVIGTILFAGTSGSGVYRSNDKGNSWVKTELSDKRVFSFAVMSTILFAGTEAGVFRSDDDGRTWNEVNDGLTNTPVSALAVMGTILFAGTKAGVFRSDDGGRTWNEVNDGLTNTPVSALAVMGTILYAGTTDGGIFRSDDRGRSWVNKGLPTATVTLLAVMGATLYAGTYQGVFRSNDKGNSWVKTELSNKSVNSFAVMGTILFVGTSFDGVYRSEDSGNTWAAVNKGLRDQHINSLAVMGKTIFTDTDGGVFRSKDGGNNWIEVNNALMNKNVNSLAVMGETLFAGTEEGGVFRSDDEGNSWIEVNNGLIKASVSSLAVMGKTILVGTWEGVYRSEDLGDTWIAINNGLRDKYVNSLAVMGKTLFAGTGSPFTSTVGGVYRSEDLGDTWIGVNQGLTNKEVLSLAAMDTTLFAGTGSGGVFRISLPDIPILFTPDTPILSIIRPKSTQVFPSGTTSMTLTVIILNHTSHWHWQLNAPFPSSGAAGGNIVTSGNTATITGLTDGQTYTVYVALVDANHNILNPPVTAGLKFSVAESPTLSILNPTPNQVFPAGTKSMTLIVNIANHNGYWHWQLDTPFPNSGSAGGNAVLSGNTTTITGLASGNTYIVYVTLVDKKHDILSPPITASVKFLIDARKNYWDIDDSGRVDIIDLLKVAIAFGSSGKGLPADIDDNGMVDIIDLVIVVSHFGEVTNPNPPAAPQMSSDLPMNLPMNMLERLLKEARAADDGSETFRRGIAVLERLLRVIVPEQTALLQNYPNPFNPETWIPYQLANSTDVSIRIYDLSGRIVRTLNLGRKDVGLHLTKDRAVYWDGKNDVGEHVSSGTYFYELAAGNFRSVKKMIISK